LNIKSLTETPIIAEIYHFIINLHPIVGPILGIILLILLFSLFQYINKFNLIEKLLVLSKKISKEEIADYKRKKFSNTISSKDYVNWQNRLLSKIYSDQPIVHLFGRDHMAVVHPSSGELNLSSSHDELLRFSELISTEIPEYKPDRQQKKYYGVMSANIKQPELIGFELEEYKLNSEGYISSFSANVCQYRHTVVTSHILEYEIYQLYKKNKKLEHASAEEILNYLPYRKQVHNGQTNTDVILKGKNRHALLSVQMMIVFWDEKFKCFRVPIIKRSDKVTLKPNYWQIVPAGGFEIFEKEGISNEQIIEENFDIKLALYRELLEELYNGRDFEDNEKGIDGNSAIYQNPIIQNLKKLIKDGAAKIEFLGNTTDLTTLRPELSFLLVVTDKDFARNAFIQNFEGDLIKTIKLDGLEKMFKNDLLYPSSAGLLKLALDSKALKEELTESVS
jgi:hypothetical protein